MDVYPELCEHLIPI